MGRGCHYHLAGDPEQRGALLLFGPEQEMGTGPYSGGGEGAQSLAPPQWVDSDREEEAWEGTGGVVWSFDDTVGSRESVKG